MGSYENIAVRDASGQIAGYQNVQSGQFSPGTGSINYVESALPPVASQTQQLPMTSSSFDMSTARGIAEYTAHVGGKTTGSLADIAASEGFSGSINVVRGIDTVPSPSKVQLTSAIPASAVGPTADIYMPVGDFSQVRIPDAKAVVSESGELGVYQQYYVGDRLSRNLMLVGGGGRAALQSGMFSVNEPLTTRIYERGELANFAPLPSGYEEKFSRLGAEAYGGYAGIPIDTRTIESSKAQLSTYADKQNLAGLVDPLAVNKGKSELPGANIPSSISTESPTIQFADETGLTGKYVNIERSEQKTIDVQVKGTGPVVIPKTPEITSAALPTEDEMRNYHQAVLGGYSGGLLGFLAFGTKSPEVVKGAFGSVLDSIPSWFGITPIADTMRVTDTGYTQFQMQRESSESNLLKMQEYGKTTFGVTEEGKIKVEASNPEAAAFQKDYETASKQYGDLISSGVEKGYIIYKEGKPVTSSDQFTYEYGEFSKWGVGAGEQVRKSLGFTKPQLEAYGEMIERKQGVENIPEKIVYGTGYTLSTHPERIITAVGTGAALVLGGEVLGGVAGGIAEIPAVSSRLGSFAQAFPTAAKALPVAFDVGVTSVFTGATYYGASEGLTATPERTTVNLGKMFPELGAMVLGGAGTYAAARAIDAGGIGFGTKKVDYAPGYQPRTIDLTIREAIESPKPTAIGSIESPLELPQELVTRQSLREPYVSIGKTRYSYDALAVEPLPIRPMAELPGVRDFMTGEEISPLSTASGFSFGGPATFEQMRVVSEFKRLGDIGVNIYGQPRSVRTELFAESRLPISATESESVARAVGLRAEEIARPGISSSEARRVASDIGLRIEPLETPKGLERRFGGAPMDQRMFEQTINPEIASSVSKTTYRDIGIDIKATELEARFSPSVKAYEEQRILPSATDKTFDVGVIIDPVVFSRKLESVLRMEEPAAIRRYTNPITEPSKEIANVVAMPEYIEPSTTMVSIAKGEKISVGSSRGVVMQPVELRDISGTWETVMETNAAALDKVSVPSVADISIQTPKPKVADITSLTKTTITPYAVSTPSVATYVDKISTETPHYPDPTRVTTTLPSRVNEPIPFIPSTPFKTIPKTTDILPSTLPPVVILPPVIIPPLSGGGGGGAPFGGAVRGAGKFAETFYIGPSKWIIGKPPSIRKSSKNIFAIPKYRRL